MITCERCKTENLDSAQYCDECGAPLRPNWKPKLESNLPLGSRENPSGANPFNKRPEGQNGSHSPAVAPHPEVAAGRASAAINPSASVPPAEKAHASLVIERGKSVGKQFLLGGSESQIGRWDADGGVFPDVDLDSDDPEAKVSRRHARIYFADGKHYLEDLGSTNGTFVNRGKRLAQGTREILNDGDEIIVGKTFLRFHVIN